MLFQIKGWKFISFLIRVKAEEIVTFMWNKLKSCIEEQKFSEKYFGFRPKKNIEAFWLFFNFIIISLFLFGRTNFIIQLFIRVCLLKPDKIFLFHEKKALIDFIVINKQYSKLLCFNLFCDRSRSFSDFLFALSNCLVELGFQYLALNLTKNYFIRTKLIISFSHNDLICHWLNLLSK